MTQLLISVCDQSEAASIRDLELGIVDLKDPGRGALGAISRPAAKKIVATLGDSAIKSLALGELSDWLARADQDPACRESESPETPESIDPTRDQELLQEFDFAKVGLSQLAAISHWQDDWLKFMRTLPQSVRPVGVAYADAELANCPSIESVVELVVGTPHAALLLDTFSKTTGSLCSLVPPKKIAQIVAHCRLGNTPIALAGSVGKRELKVLLDCRPDWIGVRGAVCREGRTTLDRSRALAFVSEFQQARAKLNAATAEI